MSDSVRNNEKMQECAWNNENMQECAWNHEKMRKRRREMNNDYAKEDEINTSEYDRRIQRTTMHDQSQSIGFLFKKREEGVVDALRVSHAVTRLTVYRMGLNE